MKFIKNLFGSKPGINLKEFYIFRVKCRRCGEVIEGRVDVDNDLSIEYEDAGDNFYCRKVLMGNTQNLCYQQIEVTLKFDSKRKLIDRQIKSGGDFSE